MFLRYTIPMNPSLIDLLEYCEKNPHMRPAQAFLNWLDRGRFLLVWDVPKDMTSDQVHKKLGELSELGIVDTYEM